MSYKFPPPHSQGNSNPNETLPHTPILPMQVFSVPPPPVPPPVSFIIPPPVSIPLQQYALPQYQVYNVPSHNPNSGPPISVLNAPCTGEYPSQLLDNSDKSSNDVLWVKDWLSRKVQASSGSNRPSTTLKVYQAKECLKNCIIKLDQLKTMQHEVLTKLNSMDSDSWESALKVIHQKANELEMSLTVFENPKIVEELKKALVKRTKKRESQKRRQLRHREMQLELNTRRQQLHRFIDSWLKDMQDALEKAKIRESLKEEADSILSGVTRKKTEARRQLALLLALGKLHEVRMQSAVQEGQQISAEHGIRFCKVTDHLKKLWEKQLKGYNLEEQGLRVMLSEAVDERDQTKVLREKQNLERWRKLLFGENHQNVPGFYTAAETDVEAFMNIRRQWDKFITSTETPMSATIPIGWVLPTPPSSSQWETVLCSPESVEQ